VASKNIAHAKKVLKIYDIEGSRIKMIRGEAEEPEKFAESIRDFVKNLSKMRKTKLKKKRPIELSTDKDTTERGVLLSLLQGFSNKLNVKQGTIVGDFPFGDVLIDTQKCTLCSACANYCSTDALKSEDMPGTDGWVPKVTFTHTYCIACDICEDICPEKAIRVKRVFDLERFIGVTGEELKVELTNCVKCGQPIMARTAYNKLSNTLKKKEQEIPKYCRDCRDRATIADLFGIDEDSEDFKIIEQGKSIFEHRRF
jgi:ferredoxin